MGGIPTDNLNINKRVGAPNKSGGKGGTLKIALDQK